MIVLLAPAALAILLWGIAVAELGPELPEAWRRAVPIFVSLWTFASPLTGVVLWSLLGRGRWRRAEIDLTAVGDGAAPLWVFHGASERLGVITPASGAASVLVDAEGLPDEGERGPLRLWCLRGPDGLRLLASFFMLVQVVLTLTVALVWIPNELVEGYGLSLLVLWPFTLAWTFMPYAATCFGVSPWAVIDLSAEGARLTTWTDYLIYRTRKSSTLREIETADGGLSVAVDGGEGEPVWRMLVRLPGGSVSTAAQAALAVHAFRELAAARAERGGEGS